MPMPSPPNKRRPETRPGASRQLVIGNGPTVRKQARREYDQAKRKLDQARQQIDRFKTEDRPAFDTWLHRTFGAVLTELRDLARQHHDQTQLMMEVEDISLIEGISQSEAYRLALHRRAHPEEIPPPPNGNPDDAAKFAREFSSHDFPPGADPLNAEGFAEFARAFADFFGGQLPPGMVPPGLNRKPNVNSRVKELYRNLVRKLHPDSHGPMTPEKLEWWHEVQEAYAEADTARLELILNLCEMQDGSTASHTSVSMLHRITAQFKTTLRAVKRELKGYRREPAWNFSQSPDHAPIEQRVRDEVEAEHRHLRQRIAGAEQLLRVWASETPRPKTPGQRRRKRKAGANVPFADTPFLF